MSEISIDSGFILGRMNDQVRRIDSVDAAFSGFPEAVDGGRASSMIATLVAAAVEGGVLVADSQRALAAITIDVLKDTGLSEQQRRDELDDITKQLDEQ
jgi:hypothetical protein